MDVATLTPTARKSNLEHVRHAGSIVHSRCKKKKK